MRQVEREGDEQRQHRRAKRLQCESEIANVEQEHGTSR
jgi:hypothetical protein